MKITAEQINNKEDDDNNNNNNVIEMSSQRILFCIFLAVSWA